MDHGVLQLGKFMFSNLKDYDFEWHDALYTKYHKYGKIHHQYATYFKQNDYNCFSTKILKT